MKRVLGAVLLSTLLGACQDEEATAQPPVLTTVLPSPAVPGQTVVLYGRLPADARQITLSRQAEQLQVVGQPVRDGVSFQVPAGVMAGLYDVSLRAVDGQKVPLDVVPTIRDARLDGTTLRVDGLGWGDHADAVLVEVNGVRVTPKVDGQMVTVDFASSSPGAEDLYGALNIRLVVGERASEVRTIRKEAMTVRGVIERPMAAAQPLAPLARQSTAVTPSRTLIISGSPQLPVEGLVNQRAVLGRMVATYTSVEAATLAWRRLRDEGASVTFDQVLTVGSQATAQQVTVADQSQQWFWPRLGLNEAWARSRGAGVTVAVIDTGVALNHPDLQRHLLPGWDFVEGDAQPDDQNGHGTHVAGLVAASGHVTGAAPEARILPVKVIGPQGGSVSDLAQGLLWAAGLDDQRPNPNPAQVINLSLGTPEYSDLLVDAVQRVLTAGVIVVAATGNDGGLPYAPANIPGVIAVTSVSGPVTTYQPGYANRGFGTRLAAFGGDMNADQDKNGDRDGILSTDIDPNGQPTYALRSGTSMASPQVAGVAALLLADHVPAQAVKRVLEGQATDLGVRGLDSLTGWGLVNATAVSADADTYVVAFNSRVQVITYVRSNDSKFELHSLPPDQTVTVRAGTDRNGNGVIGEAGELLSSAATVTNVGPPTELNLTLSPSDGSAALSLPK